MAEKNVAQEGSFSKSKLEKDLMSLVRQMDQDGIEYLIRMARREILWKEDQKKRGSE